MLMAKFGPYLTCVQCVVGLCRRLKLFFAEPTAHWVGVKPEPIEEPVLLRCDDNHSPNAVMMRAIIVNNLDSLINLESGHFRPPDIWIA
jgi:hypothetical protein